MFTKPEIEEAQTAVSYFVGLLGAEGPLGD